MSMVVELCGLPGAGKTTIARALVDQLRLAGVDTCVADDHVSASTPLVPRLSHKTASAAAVLSANPSAELLAARVLGSGQRSARDMIALPVLWWARKHVVAQSRRSAGAAILEEGLVQALWSAGLRSTASTPPTLVALAESATRPDVVVHVDVPPRRAVERLRSRPSRHSRLQRMDVEDQLAAMRQGEVLLTEILSDWTRRNLSDVVVVDGTAPDCAAQLAADLLGRRQIDTTSSG